MSTWGEPTVDAFASPATALAQRWWSLGREPMAEACDAFAQQWGGERLWVHPPPSALPRTAQMLRATSGAEATVCAPHWPGEMWHSQLLEIADEYAVFPAGSLRRVAADAPARLESWPVVLFHIPAGPRGHGRRRGATRLCCESRADPDAYAST